MTNVQRVATSIQKKVSSLQKTSATVNSTTTVQKALSKPVGAQKVATTGGSVRAVVKESVGGARKVVVNSAGTGNAKKIIASTQNSQRIVLQPTSKPNTVVIENLAASTSEAQIRRMCQGLGTLEVTIFFPSLLNKKKNLFYRTMVNDFVFVSIIRAL